MTTESITELSDDVLFSNRDLHLLWLPPIFHSPSLHALPSGVLSWHWRCDLTFFSWLNGVTCKAGDKLSPELVARTGFIRSYICAAHGITDDNWQQLMSPPGAKLPIEFQFESVRLCDMHSGPEWPGINEAARQSGYENPLRTAIFDPPAFKSFLNMQEYAAKKKAAKHARTSKPVKGSGEDVPF